jgi:hypothetical protein
MVHYSSHKHTALKNIQKEIHKFLNPINTLLYQVKILVRKEINYKRLIKQIKI